ncbi:transporter [Lactiplantibacillus plantarum]|uniref:transporter n=1 Tax=Lactiplantibacillus plantarum TaxID=1590 RepID=UPI0030ADB3F2
MKLKINIWTGILDVINCLLFVSSWFIVFMSAFSDAANGGNSTDGIAVFFYTMAWIGLILNIIALIQSKKHNISLVGSILGIIGNGVFCVSAAFAFPAIVLLIIATVFIWLQHPSNKVPNN